MRFSAAEECGAFAAKRISKERKNMNITETPAKKRVMESHERN